MMTMMMMMVIIIIIMPCCCEIVPQVYTTLQDVYRARRRADSRSWLRHPEEHQLFVLVCSVLHRWHNGQACNRYVGSRCNLLRLLQARLDPRESTRSKARSHHKWILARPYLFITDVDNANSRRVVRDQKHAAGQYPVKPYKVDKLFHAGVSHSALGCDSSCGAKGRGVRYRPVLPPPPPPSPLAFPPPLLH